jgi:hypothetical protein
MAIVALGGLVAFGPAPAAAQSSCDAGKLKEYGKKVFCLEKVDSQAAKKGLPPDAAKEQKCIDKFAEKCAKAESKGDCTGAVKSCADLMTEADACRTAAEGPGGTTTSSSAPPTTTTSTTTSTTSTTASTLPVCNGCDPCNEMCTNCIDNPSCGWFDLGLFNTCMAGFGFNSPTPTACDAFTTCSAACNLDPFGAACGACSACSQEPPQGCL